MEVLLAGEALEDLAGAVVMVNILDVLAVPTAAVAFHRCAIPGCRSHGFGPSNNN